MDVARLELDFARGQGSIDVIDAAGARTLPLAPAALARLAPLVEPTPTCLVVDGVTKTALGDERAVEFTSLLPLLRAALAEVRPLRSIPGTASEARFWASCYREGGDGWEMMRAAPPLERWFGVHSPRGKRALVVGCGRGHEARLLARLGAAVVAVDFTAEALDEARPLATAEGLTIDFRQRDLFRLGDEPERFDLWVEHCCFCAIEPKRRPEYVATAARVLEHGGLLVGLFWHHGRTGGPPFDVDQPELERLLEPSFVQVEVSAAPDSAPLRHGQELLAVWRRR